MIHGVTGPNEYDNNVITIGTLTISLWSWICRELETKIKYIVIIRNNVDDEDINKWSK